MLVLHVTLAVTAGAAGAGSQHQEYAFIGSRKACTGLDVNSAYCRVLKNATDSAAMGTRLAADLYDEYHKRGAGGLINGKPRPEQLRLVKFVTTFFPVAQYQHIGEGGPGSCWVMRQLKAANYSVQGQELSRTAVGAHCAGLDVRQGFLKHLDFAESEFDVFVASDVMEHVPLPDLQPTLKSILRVTKALLPIQCGRLREVVSWVLFKPSDPPNRFVRHVYTPVVESSARKGRLLVGSGQGYGYARKDHVSREATQAVWCCSTTSERKTHVVSITMEPAGTQLLHGSPDR